MYRSLLTSAWRLSIRERRLWFPALLACVLVGSGFGTAILLTLGADVSQSAFGFIAPTPELRAEVAAVWQQAQGTGTGAVVALLAYGAFLVALFLGMVWVTVVGLNAIVLGVAAAARGETPPNRLWPLARTHFWPAFAVHGLTKAATALLLGVWGTVLTRSAVSAAPTASLTAIIGFVATALILTVIHGLVPFAIAFIVLERRGAMSAIREAGALLRSRWLTVTEASFLFSVIHIGSTIAFAVGAFLISLPFIFLGNIGLTRGMGWLVAVAVAGRTAALALLLLITLAAITTFLTASWTLLWIRLTDPGEVPEPWVTRVMRR